MARRRRKSSACLDRQDSTSEMRTLLGPVVNYARRKKPDSKRVIALQFILVVAVLGLAAYTYCHFEHFHFHLTHFYASTWDSHHAQHVLGHKLLKERRNSSAAFHWFRRSADRGHPHSAYNLAAGHLSGYRTDVKQGEVRQLLKFAARNGVEEAKELLRTLCKEKPKYCDL
ncbi:hypothetical protein TYRP_018994 [Tyrophagus putrescentiae]|nr:hypothetical protein TYRP_018994 [Tyrophagus putrescentiae]